MSIERFWDGIELFLSSFGRVENLQLVSQAAVGGEMSRPFTYKKTLLVNHLTSGLEMRGCSQKGLLGHIISSQRTEAPCTLVAQIH